MKSKTLYYSLAVFFSIFALNANAQVETVVGTVVTDQAAMVAAMDTWFSTDDSDAGQTVSLLANVAGGSAESTHTIVADFPDYTSWQALESRRGDSDAWAELVRSSAAVSTNISNSLYLRVTDNGKSWNDGDYLYTVQVQVTGGGAAYAMAFEELMNSDIGKQAPGLIRLVASRAGAESSHVVLISAPSFVALNEHLDAYPGSEAFENFQSKVSEISAPVAFGLVRIVKVWK